MGVSSLVAAHRNASLTPLDPFESEAKLNPSFPALLSTTTTAACPP